MATGFVTRSGLERARATREEFEAAWLEGRRPRIEDFLTTPEPSPSRSAQLVAMIALERQVRLAIGEEPTLREYLERFPAETELVRRAFEETEPIPWPVPSSPAPSPPSTEPLTNEVTASSPPSGPLLEHGTEPRRPSPSRIPDRIGDFRPTRLLGGGGFGLVYHAWDEHLDRSVALKVALPGSLGGRDREETLLAEARLSARLRHPGIVTVYRVGRLDGESGAPFVALEYVEGSTLATVFEREAPLAFDRLALLVARVAEAIHHAHEHRVVHRDLKPANILIDLKGEPRVTDFGLAVQEDKERPIAGEIAGTPSFMAPEQVRGESHRLDGRTDLWALGVILYQGLTGRLPFPRRTKAEIYEEILEREPRPPRQHDQFIPAELERICLKCLSKRMGDRYGSAIALAEDLRAWLAVPNPPIPAIPSTHSPHPSATVGPPKVAPRGLRAFEQGDAEPFLALMPGPRGRDGVPDSVRAWQSRIDGIEQSDGVEPFSVGLLYGPSGGGKSSFVRAGLFPRLDPSTTVICLDATPFETEARLLAALRRRVSTLGRSRRSSRGRRRSPSRRRRSASGEGSDRPRPVRAVAPGPRRGTRRHAGPGLPPVRRAERPGDGPGPRRVLDDRRPVLPGARGPDDRGRELLARRAARRPPRPDRPRGVRPGLRSVHRPRRRAVDGRRRVPPVGRSTA